MGSARWGRLEARDRRAGQRCSTPGMDVAAVRAPRQRQLVGKASSCTEGKEKQEQNLFQACEQAAECQHGAALELLARA